MGSYKTRHFLKFLDTLTPRIVKWSNVTHLVGSVSMVYMVEIARFSRSDNRSCAIVGAESNSLKLIGLAGEVYKSKAPVSGDIYVISQHTHT